MDAIPRPPHPEAEPIRLERTGGAPRRLGGLEERQIEELITAARAGSASALGELLAACRSFLLSVASREIGAALKVKVGASDLVQETSFEAHRDFEQFRGKRLDELLGWLRTILQHNIATAGRRYQGTEKRDLTREIPLDLHLANNGDVREEAPSPLSLLGRVEEQEAIEQAIDRLPADQRKAVLLRNRDHLSFTEIGTALDRSTAAAHKLWVRAILRLQRELSDGSSGSK